MGDHSAPGAAGGRRAPALAYAFTDVDEHDAGEEAARYLTRSRSIMPPERRRAALAALGAEPGLEILDVGCGGGDDARILADLLEGRGRVVGLDASATLLEIARAQSPDDGIVEFVHGDAHELPFPDASFDLVRAERVLMHVRDPARVIAELVRVARPGARIACFEPDWGTFAVAVGPLAVERAIVAGWAALFRQPDIGRRLDQLFRHAGAPPQLLPQAVPIRDPEALAAMLDLDAAAAEAVRAGTVTPDEASAWLDAVRQAGVDGELLVVTTMFLAVARRPA